MSMADKTVWVGTKFAWTMFTDDVFCYIADSGIGQNELGRRSKIQKSTMSHLLSYHHIEIEKILRLCDVMGVSISDYLYV